ncbi:hypothetical protein PV325_009309 [Microctonus aethiopoides]|uniref:Uncharacterized protein n=1 Tax=Microctonus aethiopoides TaxID=144406 RepID=A0AA39C5K3_9HYME|nr:hypothetical protein PV325_009309 [Microctonus aethiopoides]KAK0095857.1 hypothetical protein PV326_007190 [Microctonus aethiopoides]KAK0158014.1 hypothetical protein PV328_011681 [Microctonus aethiopoides]
MNSITGALIALLVVALCTGLVLAQGDPTAQLTFKKIDIKTVDNPYFESWSSEIHAPGEKVTLKTPVKKDLPQNMMLKGSVEFEGSQIGEIDMSICEAFKDEAFGKDILDTGIPKGKFPRNCPAKSNGEYVLSKYAFPREKIPAGIPDGKIVGRVFIYEPGKDPYISINVEAELSHKPPGLGR